MGVEGHDLGVEFLLYGEVFFLIADLYQVLDLLLKYLDLGLRLFWFFDLVLVMHFADDTEKDQSDNLAVF